MAGGRGRARARGRIRLRRRRRAGRPTRLVWLGRCGRLRPLRSRRRFRRRQPGRGRRRAQVALRPPFPHEQRRRFGDRLAVRRFHRFRSLSAGRGTRVGGFIRAGDRLAGRTGRRGARRRRRRRRGGTCPPGRGSALCRRARLQDAGGIRRTRRDLAPSPPSPPRSRAAGLRRLLAGRGGRSRFRPLAGRRPLERRLRGARRRLLGRCAVVGRRQPGPDRAGARPGGSPRHPHGGGPAGHHRADRPRRAGLRRAGRVGSVGLFGPARAARRRGPEWEFELGGFQLALSGRARRGDDGRLRTRRSASRRAQPRESVRGVPAPLRRALGGGSARIRLRRGCRRGRSGRRRRP